MKATPWLVALAAFSVTGPALAQLFDAAEELPNAPSTTPFAGFTNYIQLVDLDGDGDLDIIAPNCSGFMSTGPQLLEVYRNDGSGVFSDYGFPLVTQKAVRQVGLGDIDRDGDIDVYVPDAATGPHFLYRNDGGVFTDVSATQLPGALNARAGAAEFADVDNDGDLDLFVGNSYSQAAAALGHVLLNDGNGVFSAGGPAMPVGSGDDPIDVDFADVDRDWDLDIVLNMHDGKSLLWLNDGNGVFSDATAMVHPMEGYHYGPSLCDIDGDGDLDMWTDNAGPGLADILAVNDGTGTFLDVTATQVLNNPPNADDNGVLCVDIDHDGDFDAVVVSLSTRERVLINQGGTFSYIANQFPASSADSSLWADFGDLNGDGRLDAVTAQGEPGSYPNKVFLANASAPVDTRAPTIIAVEQAEALDAADTPVVRYAVSDAVVTDTGPRLSRAYLKVDAGGTQEVEAVFSGGDIFRAVLPAFADGTVVSYTACAIDLRNNEGCAQPLSYTVGEPVGTGGGGQGGDGSGAGGNGSGGGAGGDGGRNSFDPGEGDGCGCVTVGAASAWSPWWLLGLLLLRRRGRHR